MGPISRLPRTVNDQTNAMKIFPEKFEAQITPLTEQYPDVFSATAGKAQAILGIGALTHDTSAALVCARTGAVLHAVAEERLSNVKHESRFPIGAIHRCCTTARKLGFVISSVAVNFSPIEYLTKAFQNEVRLIVADNKADSLFKALLDYFPEAVPLSFENDNATQRFLASAMHDAGVSQDEARQIAFRATWYLNSGIKYRTIGDIISGLFPGISVQFVNHHVCHAASAYFGSGYAEAAILVIDGQGEADTTSVYRARPDALDLVAQSYWPHSLGSFYLTVTRYLGFDHGDEYKVMGMSAYGEPRFHELLEKSMEVDDQGRLRLLETEHFVVGDVRNSGHRRFRFSEAFAELLPPRAAGTPLSQAHFDLAASAQKAVERLGVRLAEKAVALTGSRKLAIAGGVGLNGLMNEAIRQSGVCDDVFVYPASADDGTSVGAAQAQLFQRKLTDSGRIYSCYFGYEGVEQEIQQALSATGVKYSKPQSIADEIAGALAQGKIVARYRGGAEFGPRALGNRSILANPAFPEMKDILNIRVKHREEFRPFAPACLRERVHEYFDVEIDTPFMLLIARAKPGTAKVVPAVVHVDGTARVQTVTPAQNADFYAIIKAFERQTGLPMVINTSFNVNGEAIVDTPLDAIESFGFMDIDYLAIGDYWIPKQENLATFAEVSHEDYLEKRRTRYANCRFGPLADVDVRAYGPWFFPNQEDLSRFSQSVSDA
ncbi:MAG: hypothetical protein JWO70_4509 [Betaproteobacteria bacterium]|nr:hypothetical protein [Betaproteobacteria bacterium]